MNSSATLTIPRFGKRRWFQFSMRSVFVVVTVLCCWLGWQLSVVHKRQAALKELRANSTFQITTASAWAARYPAGSPVPRVASIPRLRVWLGDEAIQEFWYTSYVHIPSPAELAHLARMFPEAEFRESFPEPCHPGCFPRGTLVETPQGLRAIESLQPGDFIAAFNSNGEALSARIQSVFVTDNQLWKMGTEAGDLITTQTQPLCLSLDRMRQAGKLQAGDTILCYRDSEFYSVRVLEVQPTDRIEKVFNLILGDSELFIAGGFLARSKPPAGVAAR